MLACYNTCSKNSFFLGVRTFYIFSLSPLVFYQPKQKERPWVWSRCPPLCLFLLEDKIFSVGLIFSLHVHQHKSILFLSLSHLLEHLLGQWLCRFKTLDKQIKLCNIQAWQIITRRRWRTLSRHHLDFSRSDHENTSQQLPESSLIVFLDNPLFFLRG